MQAPAVIDAPDISLVLPEPPSANRMKERSRATGTHFRTSPYRAWLTEIVWLCAQQRHGDSIPGAYAIRIVAGPTRKDLGNLEKPTQDGLKEAGVIRDDRHCQQIIMERDSSREPASILVELWSLPEPAPKRRAKR
jgi:Holliday junction resolvase RusA-like endonuclease